MRPSRVSLAPLLLAAGALACLGTAGVARAQQDLRMDSVLALSSPTPVYAAGGAVKLQATFCRLSGTPSSAYVPVFAYYSYAAGATMDVPLCDGATGTPCQTRQVSTITACSSGGTVHQPQVIMPPQAIHGPGYLGVHVDPANLWDQVDGNDYRTVAISVTGKPDLIVSALSATVSPVPRGGDVLPVSYTIKNDASGTNGTGAAVGQSVLVSFYLSTDGTWSADDTLIGTDTLTYAPSPTQVLVPQASTTRGPSPTLPTGVSAGQYYLLAYVDQADAVVESSNANNTATFGPFEVQADPARVDLLSFTATRAGRWVALSWRTGAEAACGAFSLLRCEVDAGECAAGVRRELPDLRVPCAGDAAGTSYAVIDESARGGAGYAYWLLETETSGAIRVHGPVEVDPTTDAQPLAGASAGRVGPAAAALADPAGGCSVGAGAGGPALLLLPWVAVARSRRRR